MAILFKSAERFSDCNIAVHETLALNNGSKHGDNSKTSQHSLTFCFLSIIMKLIS